MTDVMASDHSGSEEPSPQGRVKLPVATLLFVVVFGVWLGLAGGVAGVYFLAKSGKLPLPLPVGPGTGAAGAASHPMVLEPILVNLADEGGHAYLRLGLTLDVIGDSPAAALPEAGAGKPQGGTESAVRDIVLTVLGRQTSASLLGPDGKEHLKIELKEAIAKSDLKVEVKDLYFSDFLVQI
jgi:flagellar FliL protein